MIIQKDTFTLSEYATRNSVLSSVLPSAVNECYIPDLKKKGIPYSVINDLAIQYYIPATDDSQLMTVTNNALSTMCISFDEIREAAERNMWNAYDLSELPDVLNYLDSHRRYAVLGLEVYIATTRNRIYGGGLIASPIALHDIAQRLDSFFMLPTSMHEYCIIPQWTHITINELYDTICEINTKYTPLSDRLSDNVYIVDGNGQVDSYF